MTNEKLTLLTPQNSQLIFIDHQPQMAFGVQNMDRQVLKNNVVGLAKAAKVFDVPTTQVQRIPSHARLILERTEDVIRLSMDIRSTGFVI